MRWNANATVAHQPQLQSGRNITCDNFFTFVQLLTCCIIRNIDTVVVDSDEE